MPGTHFIMIFLKFKWPNTQIPIFCIHMINNVYRKVKECLKLDLSAEK